MSTRSSGGDPARALALLWRHATPAARGPKPSLSVDAVVKVAIRMADANGIDAVSMRALAAELGVTPMALYRYVPGRAELVDLMLDTVYARMRRRRGLVGWRPRIEAIAHENRALYAKHPWLASIATGRPPLGPGAIAKYDYELGALVGTGLSDLEMDAALTFVLGFVESCARAAADARATERETMMNDKQWWQANEPLLARIFEPGRYPLASRVGTAVGTAQGTAFDPERAYAFGLGRVLDGLEALIRKKRKTSTKREVVGATKR